MSKIDYNKMSNIQQMEFDLKQMHTQELKNVMVDKHKGKQPKTTIVKRNKSKYEAYNKLSVKDKLEYDIKDLNTKEKELRHAIRDKGYKAKNLNNIFDKVVGKYNPTIQFIKNLKFKGKDIISIRIDENKFDNNIYSVNKIEQICNKLTQTLKTNNINGSFMCSLDYAQLGWKPGYLRPMGDDTVLYDPNEIYNLDVAFEVPKQIKHFNLYVILGKKSKKGGADDKFNDCLFNSLKYFIFNFEDYYKSASELKYKLGIKRDDKIPISCIDEIEKTINKKEPFQINIRGDYIRSSIINTNKQANISLLDGHYEPEKLKRNLSPYCRYNEKKILLVSKKDFEAYNGINKWTMTKEEFYKYTYDYENEYIMVSRTDYMDKGSKLIMTIEEEYNYFITIINDLKTQSKGLINLYKSGSYYNACLSLFDYVTKNIDCEEILQDEAYWIKMSSSGALKSCEEYEGKLYKYDVNSLYPSIQKSSLKFPIKRGEFLMIDEMSEYIEFGFYRAVIIPSEDEQYNKLIRFNKNNFYSCVDLQNAKQLGFKIELTLDDKPNFLKYTRDKLITFGEVFNKFIDVMYPLKEKKVKQSKFILNMLWGALCAVDKKKQFVTESFNIESDEQIYNIVPSRFNKDQHCIKTTSNNHFYKTNFARLCPFLLSNGRKIMSNFMRPHYKSIKRIVTDSIEITEPIHFNTNVCLGELKYEGICENAIIKNCANKLIYA